MIDNRTTETEQRHVDDEVVYGFQFCDEPDSMMLGETMFNYDGEPVGWIVANGVKRGNAITDNRMTDNRTTELLPCPFCGGEASKRLFYKGKYRVHCNVCDAHSGDVRDTEAEAIEAWNARAELGSGTCEFKPFADEDWSEPNAVRGVCSKCSALMYGKDNYCSNCGRKAVKR